MSEWTKEIRCRNRAASTQVRRIFRIWFSAFGWANDKNMRASRLTIHRWLKQIAAKTCIQKLLHTETSARTQTFASRLSAYSCWNRLQRTKHSKRTSSNSTAAFEAEASVYGRIHKHTISLAPDNSARCAVAISWWRVFPTCYEQRVRHTATQCGITPSGRTVAVVLLLGTNSCDLVAAFSFIDRESVGSRGTRCNDASHLRQAADERFCLACVCV